jgi:phospholipase/carboxylesterase
MKRIAILTGLTLTLTLTLGFSAGAATAPTVASLGLQGLDAASGKAPKQLVVLFHGYTQKGEAMKPLAEALSKRLPNAAFVFTDGPLDAGPGKSWYVMRGEDTQNTKAAAKDLALKTLKTAADGFKIAPQNIVVVGFSQGGGMAFDAGACSSPDVKAIVSLAGVLETTCPKEAQGTPAKVLIVRNDNDPLVKIDRIQAFQDALKTAGYESTLETVSGATHWPAEDGIKKAEDFIVAELGGK